MLDKNEINIIEVEVPYYLFLITREHLDLVSHQMSTGPFDAHPFSLYF